ncbi:MAG: pyridoxamine 5'-phosphate oxidase family protein [Sulfurimonadaceae bacterium]
MRRNEFEVNDPEAIERFLAECDYGVLSIISDGAPYGVALNFAFGDGMFYFHGALEGKKAQAISTHANCSFTAVKPYAYIPSYLSDTRSACPATQFYASVVANGAVVRIDEGAQKAFGLNALMQKMQPEGGYEAIDMANPIYTKMLEKTAVYAIKPETITFKVKTGQNLPKERKASLIEKLQARGEDETIQQMKEHL